MQQRRGREDEDADTSVLYIYIFTAALHQVDFISHIMIFTAKKHSLPEDAWERNKTKQTKLKHTINTGYQTLVCLFFFLP